MKSMTFIKSPLVLQFHLQKDRVTLIHHYFQYQLKILQEPFLIYIYHKSYLKEYWQSFSLVHPITSIFLHH